MADSKSQHPLIILRDIERRSRRYAAGLPHQQEVKSHWLGIGFLIQHHRFVSSLVEVHEILHYPFLSRVPGVKSWVKGVSNVRGNLLPVVDLQDFVTGQPTPVHRRSRILVINHDGFQVGLHIGEMLGLRRFLEEERIDAWNKFDGFLSECVDDGFEHEDEKWSVFSMQKLTSNHDFIHVSL